MKKIPSLFKRNYGEEAPAYNEVNEGCEWVLEGEGVATVKWDGTCCLVRDGKLYKRRDRKINKKTGKHKDAPEGWEAAQEPDPITGHWPGWMPVDPHSKEDARHMEAWKALEPIDNQTYELVGPKINRNPHDIKTHTLIPHGNRVVHPGRSFEDIRTWLGSAEYVEGIVWHHPDGRMAKIKRSDFGFEWNSMGDEKMNANELIQLVQNKWPDAEIELEDKDGEQFVIMSVKTLMGRCGAKFRIVKNNGEIDTNHFHRAAAQLHYSIMKAIEETA